MSTVEVTKENFQDTIEKNPIVLIDYWADWCGPCKAFSPVFESAAAANPDIVFGKCNTEEQPELASAFNIRSIPTLMVFRDQILLFAQPGALPASALNELITKVKALDMNEVRKEIAKHEAEHDHDCPPGHNCGGHHN